MSLESLKYKKMASPLGELILVASGKGLQKILWNKKIEKNWVEDSKSPVLKQASTQLNEYFAGKRKKFDLPLDLHGTSFQQQAWKVLCKIPYGRTLSYQEQAIKLGDAKKCRAVGGANGKNPLPIIIPCHRVITKNGKLGGFTGGLKKKQILLELESLQK